MTANSVLTPSLNWSGALRRKTGGNPAFAQWLEGAAAQTVNRKTITAWHNEIKGTDSPEALPVAAVRRVLRQLRERVFFALMVRDINKAASLHEVVTAMSALADLAVAESYRSVATELSGRFGIPIDPNTGKPQEMLIVGMGKLGGRELNVSSDIDLIMLYGEEGETSGPRKISHHEFYGHVTRRLMPVLSEVDADGQVFRTDLRLRPNGDAGPLAWSLDALENYLILQGREWERYAWLKARVIPARAFADSDTTTQREQLVSLHRPFVYRKYFDFDALASLRGLRQKIRLDWQRRAHARTGVDTQHNIKLGEGGIREIEFVVQLTQLIRGGRMPSLQQPNLLAALYKQKKAGIVSAEDAAGLEAAYVFLRRTEHMLQYREDQQTHLLPQDARQRGALAQAFGLDTGTFDATLAAHRAFVSQAFRDAFRTAGMRDPDDHATQAGPGGNTGTGTSTRTSAGKNADGSPPQPDADDRDAEQPRASDGVRGRIDALLASHKVNSLPRASRKRLEALMPGVVRAAEKTDNPEQTANRLLDLVEHIAQRSAYLALLAEYPETLARVARIVGASSWAAQYLSRYPLLLDGLIEWHSLLEPVNFRDIADQLQTELSACVLADGQPDIEQQMNLMRDVQHQVSFQLLTQNLEGVLTVEKLADQLSALADILLAETLARVWPLVQPKGQPPADLRAPRFAIIAYGKLGGKEIGYASDLDLVFIYDDEREDANEIYAKLGRRITSWLSTMTSSGRLYDVDLRLRPDGDAGLLAASLDAFTTYQLRQAWAWEHQALTRARFVAGDTELGARFESVRRRILLLPRDRQQLKEQVRSMRRKISAGHPNKSNDFDLKHDRGGMVDVEFITQYLVLSHASEFPALLDNLGNITLLRLASDLSLIPADLALAVADAYRVFRKKQHALRLQGAEKARIPADALTGERDAVMRLWDTVIGD
jgi:glutamate-ammonia-ligase adenylyltransferase